MTATAKQPKIVADVSRRRYTPTHLREAVKQHVGQTDRTNSLLVDMLTELYQRIEALEARLKTE